MKCLAPLLILVTLDFIISLYFGLMVIMYGQKKIIGHDLMNVKIMNIYEDCCSGWAFSHLLLFMLLGYLYPDCWIVLILGALWEVVESVVNMFDVRGSTPKHKVQYEVWWSASIKDIVLNTVGFLIGRTIRKMTEKENDDEEKEN